VNALIAVRGREHCRLGRVSSTQARVGWDRPFDLQDLRRRPLPSLLPHAIHCDNGESTVLGCPLGTTENESVQAA
jgi:hypothetical protein